MTNRCDQGTIQDLQACYSNIIRCSRCRHFLDVSSR